MSLRSQKLIVSKETERLANLKQELETANRVLARMKADHKIQKKRLIKIVSDKIKDSEKYLVSESKKPDRLAYDINQKKAEIIELRKKLKAQNKKVAKEEKKLAKMQRKK